MALLYLVKPNMRLQHYLLGVNFQYKYRSKLWRSEQMGQQPRATYRDSWCGFGYSMSKDRKMNIILKRNPKLRTGLPSHGGLVTLWCRELHSEAKIPEERYGIEKSRAIAYRIYERAFDVGKFKVIWCVSHSKLQQTSMSLLLSPAGLIMPSCAAFLGT